MKASRVEAFFLCISLGLTAILRAALVAGNDL